MIVLDTHVLVWWVSGARQLTSAAKRAIARQLDDRHPLIASAISMFEIATAIRRGRLELAVPADQWLADLRVLPEVAFEPISARIAEIAGRLSDEFPGDPADRIIVATALSLGAKLVTADERLRKTSGVSAIW